MWKNSSKNEKLTVMLNSPGYKISFMHITETNSVK